MCLRAKKNNVVYREPAPDPHRSTDRVPVPDTLRCFFARSRTGSCYDWLACGTPLACRRRGFGPLAYKASVVWRQRLSN